MEYRISTITLFNYVFLRIDFSNLFNLEELYVVYSEYLKTYSPVTILGRDL